jgi:hypothetical protein
LKFIFNTKNDSSKSKTGMAKIYLEQTYCIRIKRNKRTAQVNLIPIIEKLRMSFLTIDFMHAIIIDKRKNYILPPQCFTHFSILPPNSKVKKFTMDLNKVS